LYKSGVGVYYANAGFYGSFDINVCDEYMGGHAGGRDFDNKVQKLFIQKVQKCLV
jgi:hypothetical protein